MNIFRCILRELRERLLIKTSSTSVQRSKSSVTSLTLQFIYVCCLLAGFYALILLLTDSPYCYLLMRVSPLLLPKVGVCALLVCVCWLLLRLPELWSGQRRDGTPLSGTGFSKVDSLSSKAVKASMKAAKASMKAAKASMKAAKASMKATKASGKAIKAFVKAEKASERAIQASGKVMKALKTTRKAKTSLTEGPSPQKPTVSESNISLLMRISVPVTGECMKRGIPFVTLNDYSVDKAVVIRTGLFKLYTVYDFKVPSARCIKVFNATGNVGVEIACQEALRLHALSSVTGVPVVEKICLRPAGLILKSYSKVTFEDLLRCPPKDEVFLRALVRLCVTLNDIHTLGYVNNDVQARNISVDIFERDDVSVIILEHNMMTKIGEVGPEKFAENMTYNFYVKEQYEKLRCVNFRWCAPELFHQRLASPASDVYSVAVLLDETLDRMEHRPDGLKTLLGNGLSEEPRSRPSMLEFVDTLKAYI